MQRELELKTRQLLNEKQNGGTSQAVVPGMGGGPRCWLCERWMVIDFCFTLGDSSVPDKFDAVSIFCAPQMGVCVVDIFGVLGRQRRPFNCTLHLMRI